MNAAKQVAALLPIAAFLGSLVYVGLMGGV
jgi:hypothetical protein